MKYLGSICGQGVLEHDGVGIAAATYEVEGYLQQSGRITGSGEIAVAPDVLQSVIDQPGLQLLTSNGCLLDIKFSDRNICAGDYMNVDVSGNLPAVGDWHH